MKLFLTVEKKPFVALLALFFTSGLKNKSAALQFISWVKPSPDYVVIS